MPGSLARFFHNRITGLLFGVAVGAMGCATSPMPPRFDPARLQRLGSVQVDPVSRCVVVTGFVNQTAGAIELIACGPGGKVHESLFVMNAHPLDLQTALLLLNLKPVELSLEAVTNLPPGPRIDVWVSWTAPSGEIRWAPAESLAMDLQREQSLAANGWAFNGSLFSNGYFMALAEESYLATYWDPWAILNIRNPIGDDDERVSVDPKRVPPLHTPVTFVLAPHGEGRR